MTESLVMAAQPPTYVFPDVAFDMRVKVVNEQKVKVTDSTKNLYVVLRYHDTLEAVSDQDAVVQTLQTNMDFSSGSYLLRLSLHMIGAAYDGRSFCLEIRSKESGVEPVNSAPMNIVKEKLVIVQQPPDVWFKDEGGREKCMTVSLVLEPAPGAFVEDRVIPLDVRLLYESGNPVLNQSILRLFPDMRPNMSRGRVTVSFRIDDVSKNHQGQSFIVEISPDKQESSSMFQDIAPARTSIIAIRSKRNKRKLIAGTRASPRSVAGTPRPNMMMMMPPPMGSPMAAGPSPAQRPRLAVPMNSPYYMEPHHQAHSGRAAEMSMTPSMSWSNHVTQSQQMPMASPSHASVEWRLTAFEIHPDGTQNVSRPIYRCPQCKRLNDVDAMRSGMAEHSVQCIFAVQNAQMMYRSQMEGVVQQQKQQQQQQQQQQQMQMNQHYMAANDSSRMYQQQQQAGQMYQSQKPVTTTPTGAPMPMHTPSQQRSQMQQREQRAVSNEDMESSALQSFQVSDLAANTAANASNAPQRKLSGSMSQRPPLKISQYVNKVPGSDDGSGRDSSATNSPSVVVEEQSLSQQPTDSPSTTNFFANSSFGDLNSSSNQSSGADEDKFAFLKTENDSPNPATDPKDITLDDDMPSSALAAGIGSALFQEMTSMGIMLDQFDKGTGLEDISGMISNQSSEEDHVFYILARMYTDGHDQKLGLPAFDQFQRMLGFYSESQNDVQTQVVFHALATVEITEKELLDITSQFQEELKQNSVAVHSLPTYQHNLILLREDALMFYWSQSLPCFGVN